MLGRISNRSESTEQQPAEEWRGVPMASRYRVSSFGRVQRWDGAAWRDCTIRNERGYRRVQITFDAASSTAISVHALVTGAFFGTRQLGQVTNHKNGIRHDNRAENLEYCTPTENARHGIAIERLRNLTGNSGASLTAEGIAKSAFVLEHIEEFGRATLRNKRGAERSTITISGLDDMEEAITAIVADSASQAASAIRKRSAAYTCGTGGEAFALFVAPWTFRCVFRREARVESSEKFRSQSKALRWIRDWWPKVNEAAGY